VVIILCLQGCAGIYSVVDFEVLEPASVSFPENVGQLLIMNRAPISFDVFDEKDREGMEHSHLIIIDTAISHSTFRGVLEVLQQTPIEKFHSPFWLADRRIDTASLEDLYLTKREVNTLCQQYGADAIISLEFYSMDFDEHSIYYSDAPEVQQTHYYEVSNKVHWQIYLPGSPKPFDSYITVDTLFFTDYLNGIYEPVSSVMGMIRQLFNESGKKYGKYLVPVWTQTSRFLFTGKRDSLKMASTLTSKGDWNHAFEIWENMVGSLDSSIIVDSTLVSKAFNNMAIFFELEDNLDSASILLNLALQYDSLEVVKNYKEDLDIRILNRKEVLRQVR